MIDRSELGEENVGEPIWELRHAAHILGLTEFEEVRNEAIDYYFETFLMKFLPEVIDDVLSDDQLENLDPETTKRVAFVLLGDMVMQLHPRLAPEPFRASDSAWHQRYLRRIAKLAKIEEQPYLEFVLADIPDDVESAPVIQQLSSKLGVEVAKFFVIQPAMIELVEEDVLDQQ